MTDHQQLYDQHTDGFLHLCDFIQHHEEITHEAKAEVISIIVRDLIAPSIRRRNRIAICNPATWEAMGAA